MTLGLDVSSGSSGPASIVQALSNFHDLPDALIEYITQQEGIGLQPPRKRQKLMLGEKDELLSTLLGISSAQDEQAYVVVKQSGWDIKCSSSKVLNIKDAMERANIRLTISPHSPPGLEYFEIRDDHHKCLFSAAFPTGSNEDDQLDDIRLAFDVVKAAKSWKANPGKVWAQFGVQLLTVDGLDVIRMKFMIKWNITTSPLHIRQTNNKAQTQLISRILTKYFPDQNVSTADDWSPQDFYQNVHVPDKSDQTSANLRVDKLESVLYPFQKRTVQWLMRKEGVEWSAVDERVVRSTQKQSLILPPSFISTTDDVGRVCYISHLFSLVTFDSAPFREPDLHGGILAEEMGLGKTVEVLSLICLHKRPKEHLVESVDPLTGETVRQVAATLIIAPPAISLQWISEVNKHAPHLKVTHYEGIKAKTHRNMNYSVLLDTLADSDIVVSTYNVLAAEINYTSLNPEKSLRREPKHPRPKSPLMALQFFRVVMDEAQMIESGVSKAAVVARMVPRINSWCVTGTPVRKDVNDLLGLLIFLRYEPFASNKRIWSSLISSHKDVFRQLFSHLALRHSKLNVRNELKLPPQRRYVITMPFTPIEEQHYQELFDQMCEESGLDSRGAPLTDDWEPNYDVMRRWLVRLRKTSLHPEVSGRNRRALGHKNGPLRTIGEVLDVMTEQTDLVLRTEQRSLLAAKLKRGQLFENSPRVKEALGIWVEASKEASAMVEECREQLREESSRIAAEDQSLGPATASTPETDSDSASEREDANVISHLGEFRSRLRTSLELKHMAVFFCANAHFQIKSNDDMTNPGSPEYDELEELETAGYESAKELRQEILSEIYGKAGKLMGKLSRKAVSQSFVQIPEFPSEPLKSGLESRRIMEELDVLAGAFDQQANQLDEWREQTIRFLLQPLMDEDDGQEVTGDEYDESTKIQDEVIVYVQALRSMVADRHDDLTGQENKLVYEEVKSALLFAKDGFGAFPEKMTELLGIRQKLKPVQERGQDRRSVRKCVGELRALSTSLRMDTENGNLRAQHELSIVEKQLKTTQKLLSEQMKATSALEKEIELFTKVMNSRLDYYRQLQQVSDMVAPYEGPNNATTLVKILQSEEKHLNKIAQAKSKRRYLEHLRMEATNPQEQRICVICRENFEIGSLTVCGHQYCKECITLWWSSYRNCPVCKKKLIQADLHDITYRPQELQIQAEEIHSQERASHPTMSRKSAIYSEVSKSKLAEIKNVELDGASFTTKIDTLARHLIWLRESDPGAKSIVFSQFKDFLDVLAIALQRFRVGYSSIDKPNGIEQFKEDPSVEVFLLHARAHSSGLNLVNASHVFLCEPLLNTALELQAIARVDRIGQQQETNVWLYLVDGTVEESIHALSVKRRMQHIGQNISTGKGKAREISPTEILDTRLEEANSMELQQASLTRLLAKGGRGEMIAEEDLWECLFGNGQQRPGHRSLENSYLRNDRDVGRHLRSEAAEQRAAGA